MPITLLDIILLGVMLVSALLAMIRGFMREVLSIAAWVHRRGRDALRLCQAPALREALLQQRHRRGRRTGRRHLPRHAADRVDHHRAHSPTWCSTAASARSTARSASCSGWHAGSSSWWLHSCSSTGWCRRSQPSWVANAKSKVVLQATGDWLMSMLPDDPESTILKRLKRPKPDDGEPADAPPERSDLGSPANPEPHGYGQADRVDMQRLIEGKPSASDDED